MNAIWLLALLLVGCISRPTPNSMYDLTGIRYLQYHLLPPLQPESMSIQVLADGSVEIFADHAPIEPLLRQLLNSANINYEVRTLNLSGHVTLNLHGANILSASNAILKNAEAQAYWSSREGSPILVIANALPEKRTTPLHDNMKGTFTQKIELQHLPIAAVQKLLASITQLSCARAQETNTLIMRGPPQALVQARRICRQCDQPPPSLIMEARLYVLNPNSIQTLRQSEPFINAGPLALQYIPDQVGNYNANWNKLGMAATSNASQFGDNALLANIIEKSVAHSVASMAVVNSEKLSLHIGKRGQLLSFLPRNGTPTAQMNTVKTGVSLNITPKLLQRDLVHLEINSEQSRLADALELTANKARVNLNTEIQVPLGSWIILGGMDYYITETLDELPLWVRKTPFLMWLMTNQSLDHEKSQAILLIRALRDTDEIRPAFLEP